MEHEDWSIGGGETDRHLVADEGKGKPIVLRRFEFVLPAGSDPTDQELVSAHKGRIQAFLWRDELVLVKDLDVKRGERLPDGTMPLSIFAACQGKAGAAILDTPELLQRTLNK